MLIRFKVKITAQSGWNDFFNCCYMFPIKGYYIRARIFGYMILLITVVYLGYFLLYSLQGYSAMAE
jgi:hypothetical protein